MWSGKRPSGGGVSAAALLQHVRQIARRIIPAIQRQSRTRKGTVKLLLQRLAERRDRIAPGQGERRPMLCHLRLPRGQPDMVSGLVGGQQLRAELGRASGRERGGKYG